MDDFETHSAGTASRIAELDAALTHANAATAAAYEVAAREVECGCGAGPCQDTTNCAAKDAAAIRALATSDQQSALDKLIAEAVGNAAETAAQFVHKRLYEANMPACSYHSRDIKAAILAASKKGGV